MTDDQLKTLREGDIVRNIGSGNTYIVIRTDGERAVAIRTVEVSHAPEWELVKPSTRRRA